MDRQLLDSLSMDQLRDSLTRLGLPAHGSHESCVDALMTHYERSPLISFEEQRITHDVTVPGNAIPQNKASEDSSSLVALHSVVAALQQSIASLTQAFGSFTAGHALGPATSSVKVTPDPEVHQQPQEDYSFGDSRIARAVDLLAKQLPTFGGTLDEDVEVWLDKIELVADIHQVPDRACLLAASHKLTKLARTWFDLDHGQINSSWTTFKSAISRRFKRYISHSSVILKAEALRWNPFTEPFHEYAMNKLKILHPLRLPDRELIQYLINGIQNLAVRCSASTLMSDNSDDFLQRMGEVTAHCVIKNAVYRQF